MNSTIRKDALLRKTTISAAPAAPTRSLLSPAELSAYLGIPLATIYRWRSQRDGPRGIRVGRHVRYRVADIEAWLQQQQDRDS